MRGQNIPINMKIFFKRKKSPFLLLEIMIALALICLFIGPIVESPIFLFRSEYTHLINMELERIADNSFIEIKEKLFSNSIPFKDLESSDKKHSLESVSLQVPGWPKKEINRSYYLHIKRQKEGLNNELYYDVKIKIALEHKEKKIYTYHVFVQKLAN